MRGGDVIRVLGPIDLLTTEGERSLGGRSNREVIAALVVAGGRAVSTAQLCDVLWGDSPPRSADNSLQTYVSRLRRVLGHDTIVGTDHSYRLDVTRDQIDALRFEDLIDRACAQRDDPAVCRSLATDALALWRGDPFGDVADVEALRLETYRLDELRLVAMELILESDLALGRHELVAAELESAVEEHPYREHLWHLLIEALIAGDRRIEALQYCHRLRTTLTEAGLAPGDELERLERRIGPIGSHDDGDRAPSQETSATGTAR